jgi:hypothetical protein
MQKDLKDIYGEKDYSRSLYILNKGQIDHSVF